MFLEKDIDYLKFYFNNFKEKNQKLNHLLSQGIWCENVFFQQISLVDSYLKSNNKSTSTLVNNLILLNENHLHKVFSAYFMQKTSSLGKPNKKSKFLETTTICVSKKSLKIVNDLKSYFFINEESLLKHILIAFYEVNKEKIHSFFIYEELFKKYMLCKKYKESLLKIGFDLPLAVFEKLLIEVTFMRRNNLKETDKIFTYKKTSFEFIINLESQLFLMFKK